MKRFWQRIKEHLRASRRIRELKDLARWPGSDPNSIKVIVSAFNDRSEDVRQTAVRCLFSTLKRFGWNSVFINQAVEALEGIEEFDPGTVPIFIDALGDVDTRDRVRKVVQSSLVKIGEPAIPALEGAICSDNPKLRAAAIEPLVRMGGSGQSRTLWLDMLGNEIDGIQKTATKCLAQHIDQSTPVLLDALKHPDQRIFLGATYSLAYSDDRDAVQNILASLEPDLRQRVKDQITAWYEQWEVWIIVDDDPRARQELKDLVEGPPGRKALTFEGANQVKQWIEDFRGGRYDAPLPELTLVCTDMSDLDRFDVYRELRQIAELSGMVVVIAATRCTAEDYKRVKQISQADRIIPKIIHWPDKLIASLEEVIEARRQAEAVPQDITSQYDQNAQVWIIMDDEPMLRLVLSTLFRMWGRVPLEFEDGYQGMQWVEDFREGRYNGPIPELVISNIRQPGPQGYEVCGEMRKIPELNEMAIVIATAYRLSKEESQKVRQTAQADLYMTKPLPMLDELRAILEDMIEARRQKISGQVGEGGAA